VGVLEFIPATRRVMKLLASDPEAFAEEHGVRLHEVAQSVGEAGLAFIRTFSLETPAYWFGYLVVEGETQQMVGVCTFKGPPVAGALEISYFTFPGYEGRGIATEMARFLIQRARQLPGVKRVIAHTLPERNASGRILEKVGMSFVGDAEEDGERVWEFEIPLESGL
jgi:ribosomal-protein-alanine N-acetyltransferase